MSLEHMDNFSIYGTDETLLLDGIYAEASQVLLETDPDGISAGNVLRMSTLGGNSNNGLRFVLSATEDKVGMALRIWFPALPGLAETIPAPMTWRDVSNNFIASLTVDTTGRLSLRSGTPFGTVLGTTTGPVLTANGWWHIEAIVDNVAQTAEVRVEGITVLDLSGLSLPTEPIAQVQVTNRSNITGANQIYYIKDLVIYNGLGTYNNDFLGSVIVTNLAVASDVSLNWTPSVGTTGYEILSNIPPDAAQYIEALDPPPSPYRGTLTNLPDDVTSVKAVMTVVRAAKSDGGDGSLQTSVISNGDTANGANRPITVAQTYWRDVFETDPDTAAPWLPAAVDAADIQINRTT